MLNVDMIFFMTNIIYVLNLFKKYLLINYDLIFRYINTNYNNKNPEYVCLFSNDHLKCWLNFAFPSPILKIFTFLWNATRNWLGGDI